MSPETATLLSPGLFEERLTFEIGEPSVWFVRSGGVDLFAVRSAEHDDPRALHPIVRLAAGDAVFGMAGARDIGLSMVARRAPDAEVVRQPPAGFLEPPARSFDDSHELLTRWVSTLSQAMLGGLLPRGTTTIVPSERACATETAVSVSARDRLVWVRQVAGESHVHGRADMRLTPESAAYPLSSAGWITLQPGGEIVALDETFGGEREPGVLDSFHRFLLTAIQQHLAGVEQRGRQRFDERNASDRRALEAALLDLASPLQAARDRVRAEAGELLDTPLMRACRVIGRTSGIAITPPPDMVRGLAVKDPVAAIAQASGIRFRRVALRDTWWKQNGEPLLVFRDTDNQPLAVLPRRSGRGYNVYDPTDSKVTRLDARAIATLNPFGFMFYRPFPHQAMTPGALLAFGLKDGTRDLVTVVAMSVAAGMLTMVSPIVTGIIVDSLIPSARRTELIAVSGLLIVTALAAALFNMTRGFAVLRLQGRVSARIQAALWDRLLALPVPFFRDYAAGDLANRSMAISQIRALLTGSTLNAILSGVFSVFSFALLFYYSARLALVATVLSVCAALITLAAGLCELRLQRDISEQSGTIAGRVLEFLSGIAKFRVAGAERRAFVLWVSEFAKQKRTDFSARRIKNVVTVINSVYLVFCLGVLFAMNSSLGTAGTPALSTGQFLAFVAAFTQFMSAALVLSSAIVAVVTAVPLYERAAPILHTLPEVAAGQSDPGELTGDIEAHHLVFRYRPDTPLVLRDVSFRINPGEYVAFVGPSGCGKSTLFRLLLGFETPESGSIYFDGQDVSGLDVQAVRRQIGVVLQSGTLVSGSLQQNIAGAAWLPAEDIWEAIRLAGLEDDVKKMPMGLHTLVTEGGGGLSGGQRQRVLIARAIVGKPRLILFDEATSALDNRTQAIVSSSLRSLKATRVVIAHRLSTILEADRIFVMDQGRIVQSGTYAALLKEPGLFRELAERQLT